MIQFNLKRNDIIIILIIFLIFSIFTYINTSYENFESPNDSLANINDNRKQIIILFYNNFFIDHLTKFELIIKNDYKINENINDNILITQQWVNTIYVMSTYMKPIPNPYEDKENIRMEDGEIFFITDNNKDFMIKKNDKYLEDYKELIENFTSLLSNINKVFSEYKKLFDTPKDFMINDLKSIKSTDTCNNNIILNNFIINLKYKKDIIKNNNEYIIELINKNINDIQEYIDSKIGFKADIKSDLKENFKNYDELITRYYVTDYDEYIDRLSSPNIFNSICGISTPTPTTTTQSISNKPLFFNYYKDKIGEIKNKSNIIKNSLKYTKNTELFVDNDKDTQETYFNDKKRHIKLELKFCEKMKKLNKPNNISVVKYKNDLILQKEKYINNLKNDISNIQTLITDKEINDFNSYRLRTDSQARKQYDAITKGIDNIKNTNKFKINLI